MVFVKDLERFRAARRKQEIMLTDRIGGDPKHRAASIGIQYMAGRQVDRI